MDEETRLRVLHSLGILDTAPEESFDALVELAAAICDVPVALLTLVDRDRQWFKAKVGLDLQQTDRDVAFCAHAIEGTRPFIVADAAADSRFAENPLVTGGPRIRFYAGFPLVSTEGAALGTLCAIDRKPRVLLPLQVRALEVLARYATVQLESQRRTALLARSVAAEAELEQVHREQAELDRLIVEQSGDGIIVSDEHGQIRVFNPAAERQHGVRSRHANAAEWAATFGLLSVTGEPLALTDTPLYRAVKGERVENASFLVRRPDGSVCRLMGSAWPLTRADGTSRGGVLIVRDVTESARAAEALRKSEERARELYLAEHEARAQADRARRDREELLAIVSHDLRSPLSAIVMAATLLRKRTAEASSSEARHAEVILRAGEKMTRLIGDLLDMAAIEAGQLSLRAEPTSARRVLDDLASVTASVAVSKSLSFEIDAGEGELPLLVDCERISQVFSNLVGNAFKFTPPGGRVRVCARQGAGGVLFSVADTGRGIPTASLAHVFDRFWKEDGVSRAGVGLGLSIARGIVEAHRGRIWVESRPGEGATFFFELPRRS